MEECGRDAKDEIGSVRGWFQERKDGEATEYELEWENGRHFIPSSGSVAESDTNEPGLGLMEAFENFHLQAEKRVKKLLETTEAKLFADESDTIDQSHAPSPNTPSYILMSDQYRLTKPPQFHHWRQCFPYLQVTGKSSFDEVPDEHIQLRLGPPLRTTLPTPFVSQGESKMTVVGKALCLAIDTSDPPQEELILADGEMEEIVEEDRPDRDESADVADDSGANGTDDPRPSTGTAPCVSPRTSKAEEAVDQLTLECFNQMVPPLCTLFFESVLRSQQSDLHAAREKDEEQIRQAHERAVAMKEAELRRQEQEEQDRLLHEAAVAQAQEEERIREEERQQELLRQQLVEDDEEEIKIRTLAYSHTREWYQPKKKCFSHRGRQLTYLKPVLKVNGEIIKDSLQVEENDQLVPSTMLPRKPVSARSSRSGRAMSPTDTDIREARSSSSSRQAPTTTESRRTSRKKPSPRRPKLLLPVIHKPVVPLETKPNQQPTERRTKDERSYEGANAHIPASVRKPALVYSISPYHIPPPILTPDLQKDIIVTRRRHRKMPLDGQEQQNISSRNTYVS